MILSVLEQIFHTEKRVNERTTQLESSNKKLIQLATHTRELLQKAENSNYKNTTRADDFFKNAIEIVQNGGKKMNEMINAINGIRNSSFEIKKIIKLIDDIEFQTNLLALNASVEAARAGRHGKGFAVVSQEVRGLASKSANAAHNTSNLIEDSLKMIENGNKIATITAVAFDEINEWISKINEHVSFVMKENNRHVIDIANVNQELINQ